MSFDYKENSKYSTINRQLIDWCIVNDKIDREKVDSLIYECYFSSHKPIWFSITVGQSKYIYSKCKNSQCLTCSFSLNNNGVETGNFSLPLKRKSSCDSSGIVYIIFCTLCNSFYIGQSSRTVKLRLNEHINGIKRLDRNMDKHVSDTAIHFTSSNHILEEHFRFVVYDTDLADSVRFSAETDLINLFMNNGCSLINIRINHPYNQP